MAVKFSQFSNTSPTGSTYLVGFDGTTNVRILYSSLLSGTTNYVSKWTSSSALGNSQIFDNGTSVGIGTASPSASYKLDVSGAVRITNDLTVSTNAIINTIKIGVGLGNVNSNIGIGASALSATTTAQFNVVIGTIAGASLLSGNFNTIVGYNAGNALTTGLQNAFFGHNAGRLLTTSGYNTAFGQNAGRDITSGSDNVFVGQSAGFALSSGSGNVILGAASGGASRTGDHNIHIGYSAGINNNGGIQNIFIGKNVGTSVTAGSYNVIIGANNGSTIATSSNFMLFADGAGNERFRIPSTGNVLIGTTTDGGQRFQVNGTTRLTGDVTIVTTTNARQITFENSGLRAGVNISQPNNTLTFNNGAGFELNSQNVSFFTSANTYFKGFQGSATFSYVNNSNVSCLSILPDASTPYAWGRKLCLTGDTTITVPNASAVLDIQSTTMGFLPPRMTGAQAELIGTPAAGLLVYANNGNGAIITSIGWWGYNGTTWVKLN